MKKFITLFCLIASVSVTFAQNPYLNEDKTGWGNSFDTESDVLNDYVAPQKDWGFEIGEPTDTVQLSWVDVDGNGALKIEANFEWDWGHAVFPISTDLQETMDMSSLKISFKYKNFTAQDAALTAAYRVYVDDEAQFGGEIWEEDVVYNSDDWTEVDMLMSPVSSVLDAVYMLEVGFDGAEGSIIIDDLAFGDTTVTSVTAISDYTANQSNVNVYPNPASNYIQIMNAGNMFDVDVFNVSGQRILHAENKKRLDISSLENGIYFIKVQSGESRSVLKVMKQ